jgi:deoxyribodipyrimidine photo-lyase
MAVPALRLRSLNDAPVRGDRDFVLYWMIGQRRLTWNFALDRAVERAQALGRPLVILEGLRCDYPWASARHHRFAMDGIWDHRQATSELPVQYYPYVEPRSGAGKGLLEALAARATVVVTDDMPFFFFPRMLQAAARALDVRLEAVDSHGLLPLRQPNRSFTTAYSFRIHLHKHLAEHLGEVPQAHPLREAALPAPVALVRADGPLASILERWPAASDTLLSGGEGLGGLPVDANVPPVPFRGGPVAAGRRLTRFLEEKIHRYDEERNDPDADVGSRLSPYLHWGHLSVHQIFRRLVDRQGWTPNRIGEHVQKGSRKGWWGMAAPAEAFLDELVTWREIGFNAWVRQGSDVERFESLPDWARETLAEHADDPRTHCYDLQAFDEARTHDPLWNAAQVELRTEGTIHNYLRMLWGKKILEWSASPRDALAIMLELNDRYAVDGRDPNSTSGIMWVLGRYDRGWPERDIYGKVRSMSSDSTRRKVSVKQYLARFSKTSS